MCGDQKFLSVLESLAEDFDRVVAGVYRDQIPGHRTIEERSRMILDNHSCLVLPNFDKHSLSFV